MSNFFFAFSIYELLMIKEYMTLNVWALNRCAFIDDHMGSVEGNCTMVSLSFYNKCHSPSLSFISLSSQWISSLPWHTSLIYWCPGEDKILLHHPIFLPSLKNGSVAEPCLITAGNGRYLLKRIVQSISMQQKGWHLRPWWVHRLADR